jgi:hypothetical protein
MISRIGALSSMMSTVNGRRSGALKIFPRGEGRGAATAVATLRPEDGASVVEKTLIPRKNVAENQVVVLNGLQREDRRS